MMPTSYVAVTVFRIKGNNACNLLATDWTPGKEGHILSLFAFLPFFLSFLLSFCLIKWWVCVCGGGFLSKQKTKQNKTEKARPLRGLLFLSYFKGKKLKLQSRQWGKILLTDRISADRFLPWHPGGERALENSNQQPISSLLSGLEMLIAWQSLPLCLDPLSKGFFHYTCCLWPNQCALFRNLKRRTTPHPDILKLCWVVKQWER